MPGMVSRDGSSPSTQEVFPVGSGLCALARPAGYCHCLTQCLPAYGGWSLIARAAQYALSDEFKIKRRENELYSVCVEAVGGVGDRKRDRHSLD